MPFDRGSTCTPFLRRCALDRWVLSSIDEWLVLLPIDSGLPQVFSSLAVGGFDTACETT